MATQRNPYPGQQLGDAKGLGEVVVRAGIERLDLVLLLDARRQHDDRHLAPCAHRTNEVRAVAVGQAEIEDHQVRLARGGIDQTPLQEFGLDHPQPLGLQGLAHEAPDLGFVLDDEDGVLDVYRCSSWPGVPISWSSSSWTRGGCSSSGSVNTNRAPPRLAVLGPDAAAMRLDDGVADRQAQPDAGHDRFLLPAREAQEQRALLPRRASRAPHPRPRLPARTHLRGAHPDGRARRRVLGGVFQQVDQHPLDAARRRTSPAAGRPAGPASADARPVSRSSPCSALPTISSSDCQSWRSFSSPDCRRAISSRLSTRRVVRSAWSRIASARLGMRATATRPARSVSVSARPTSAVSGVRRSCDSAASSELRRRSDSILISVSCAIDDEMDALQRDRDQRREGVEQAALLGNHQQSRIARLDHQHAAHPHRRLERQVELRRRRQRVGADAGGLVVVVAPLRHRQVAGGRGAVRGRLAQLVRQVGQQDRRLGAKARLAETCR